MATLQIASDTTSRIIVEWNKYAPHFRIITDGSRSRGYISEEAAMRAAKRLARKLGLVMRQDRMTYQRMKREFPGFDQSTLPAIPAGWTDSSWHNDACPSFVIEDIGVQVFIDYANPAEREFPGAESRFIVTGMASDPPDDLLQTDYWTQVIDLVNRLRAVALHV